MPLAQLELLEQLGQLGQLVRLVLLVWEVTLGGLGLQGNVDQRVKKVQMEKMGVRLLLV